MTEVDIINPNTRNDRLRSRTDPGAARQGIRTRLEETDGGHVLTELGEVLGGDGVLVILVVVADGEERRVELLELHHVLVPQAVQGRPGGGGAAAALVLAPSCLSFPSAHTPRSLARMLSPSPSPSSSPLSRLESLRAMRPRRRVRLATKTLAVFCCSTLLYVRHILPALADLWGLLRSHRPRLETNHRWQPGTDYSS